MPPQTESDPQQLTQEAQTEAAEIKDDIAEAKDEAAAAREAGDTARAARLEQRITGLETKLDKALEQLTALAERPFHPAPEDAAPPADAQGRTGDGAAEKDAAPEAGTQTPPQDKPKGRGPSRRWFGDRAGSDD